MAINKYPRGSEWRKWDLHIHTPMSIVQNYGGDTEEVWEKFIKDLENLPEEFKVIGINDYLFIEGYKKVLEYKSAGRLTNLDLILPVIEFRLDKFGGTDGKLKEINYHIIFADSELLEPDVIQAQFISGLSSKFRLTPGTDSNSWNGLLSVQSLKDLGNKIKESVSEERKKEYGSDLEEGFNNLTVSQEAISELLNNTHFNKDNKRLYYTAIGKTEWDQFKYNRNSIATKKDLINSCDFIFTSAENIAKYETGRQKLKENNLNSLLLDCSDAHTFSTENDAKDRIGKCFTWIKADPTFEGLRQIINEPENRVYVGEKPPKLNIIKNSPNNFIDEVKIISATNSNEWFDEVGTIQLNHDLVSIIGNKGTGKSALADIIGSAGNANTKSYSFLCKEKFLSHPSMGKYQTNIKFFDNHLREKSFSQPDHIDTKSSKVIYFSQRFVNELCDDEKTERLQAEIERVLYSHIPLESRLKTKDLQELIEKKTEYIEKEIRDKREKLDVINKKIIQLEKYQEPEVIKKVKSNLDEKKLRLEQTISNKPKEVTNPEGEMEKSITLELKNLREEVQQLENIQVQMSNQLTDLYDEKYEIDSVINSINEIEYKYKDLLNDIQNNKTIQKYKIEISFILDNSDNLNKLKTAMNQIDENIIKAQKDVVESKIKTEEKSKEIMLKENTISVKQKEYSNYLNELNIWEKTKKEIIGSDSIRDSIGYWEKWENYIEKELDIEFNEYLEKRNALTGEIAAIILKKLGIYPELFDFAKKFTEMKAREFNTDLSDFLQFESKISFSVNFEKDFFSFINQKYSGTFYTIEKGYEQLSLIKEKLDSTSIDSMAKFPSSIIERLKKDYTKEPVTQSDYNKQINEERKLDFYNYLFGLTYIEPKFDITFGGKTISSLSPGEKGNLLLIFYLLIDVDKRPIVIDQPEENLDNQTIYQKLVPFIKKVKEERQIIIVTHNPNIAVVCDSEQIIRAHMDKLNKNQITYETGSIENMEIKKSIVDVLEGTKPAFNNRRYKYL